MNSWRRKMERKWERIGFVSFWLARGSSVAHGCGERGKGK